MTITKTVSHATMGVYKPTQIDIRKANAGFLLLQTSPCIVKFRDGKTEQVSTAELKKLQILHPDWRCDF